MGGAGGGGGVLSGIRVDPDPCGSGRRGVTAGPSALPGVTGGIHKGLAAGGRFREDKLAPLILLPTTVPS